MKLLPALKSECKLCMWDLIEDSSINDIETKLTKDGFQGATLAQVMASKKNVELAPALRELVNDNICTRFNLTGASDFFVFADNSAIVEGVGSFTVVQLD